MITIEEKIETLIAYIKVKLEEHDFHAVSDAANDLRVLESCTCHQKNSLNIKK